MFSRSRGAACAPDSGRRMPCASRSAQVDRSMLGRRCIRSQPSGSCDCRARNRAASSRRNGRCRAYIALDLGMALEIAMTTGVDRAGQRRQRRLVVRIRQAAHVEDQVRVERHAVLEAERLERAASVCDGSTLMKSLIQRAQRRRGRSAGVEAVAQRADVGQPARARTRSLRVSVRVVAGKRMPAARFREALDQRVGLGVEIEEAHGPAVAPRAASIAVGNAVEARRRSSRRARSRRAPAAPRFKCVSRPRAASAAG